MELLRVITHCFSDAAGLPQEHRYKIVEVVGQGGMATVYRGHELVRSADASAETWIEGRAVAVKVMTGESAVNATLVERFKLEGEFGLSIRNPYVVETIAFFRDADGTYCHVQEFVDTKETLENLLEHRMNRYAAGERMDKETALLKAPFVYIGELEQWVDQLLDGMIAIHDQGIVHRDLKPLNILLHKEPGKPIQVKITDFGIAKRLEKRIDNLAPPRKGITAEGTVSGTPDYLSPEQCEQILPSPDSKVGIQSDIYTFGVILYLLLTGQLPQPIKDLNWMKKFEFILHALPTPYGTYVANASNPLIADLEAFNRRLLEKDPSKRPASFREVRKEFAAIMAKHPTEVDKMPSLIPTPPPMSSPVIIPSAPLPVILPPVAPAPVPAPPADPVPAPAAATPPMSRRPYPWIFAAVASLLILVVAFVWNVRQRSRERETDGGTSSTSVSSASSATPVAPPPKSTASVHGSLTGSRAEASYKKGIAAAAQGDYKRALLYMRAAHLEDKSLLEPCQRIAEYARKPGLPKEAQSLPPTCPSL